MARDKFRYNFRRALEKDGWTITNDPLRIQAGEVKGEVDLGAEKIFAAEKDGKKLPLKLRVSLAHRQSMILKRLMDNLDFIGGFFQNKKKTTVSCF